jgi:hypothetical protein
MLGYLFSPRSPRVDPPRSPLTPLAESDGSTSPGVVYATPAPAAKQSIKVEVEERPLVPPAVAPVSPTAPTPTDASGGDPQLLAEASRAGVLGLLTTEPASGPWRTDPEPLVRRLITEMGRRTEALRAAGGEVQALRRALREARAETGRSVAEGAAALKRVEEGDDRILVATLSDVELAVRSANPSGAPSLPSAPSTTSALLALLREADPSGITTVPTLLRRVTVLASRYSAMRQANAALGAEVHALRARARVEAMAEGVRKGQGGRTERVRPSIAGATVGSGVGGDGRASRAGPMSSVGGGPSGGLDATSSSRALPVDPLHGAADMLVVLGGGGEGADLAVRGAAQWAGSSRPAVRPYAAIVSAAARTLDPVAPVSALSHARLLDEHAAVLVVLEAAQARVVAMEEEVAEVRLAHTAAAIAVARLQEGGREREGVRVNAAVRGQQAVIGKLEAALDAATQVGATERSRAEGERERANLLEAQLRRRTRELSEATARVEALEESAMAQAALEASGRGPAWPGPTYAGPHGWSSPASLRRTHARFQSHGAGGSMAPWDSPTSGGYEGPQDVSSNAMQAAGAVQAAMSRAALAETALAASRHAFGAQIATLQASAVANDAAAAPARGKEAEVSRRSSKRTVEVSRSTPQGERALAPLSHRPSVASSSAPRAPAPPSRAPTATAALEAKLMAELAAIDEALDNLDEEESPPRPALRPLRVRPSISTSQRV